MDHRDFISWRPSVILEKWDRDQVNWVVGHGDAHVSDGDTLAKFLTPYEVLEFEGNLLVTLGLNRLTNLLTGTGQALSGPTSTRIGVGDDATAAAIGDTDLSTTTVQYYKILDATYPQGAGTSTITFKSSFQDAEANFAWQCWGIDVGTPTVVSNATVNTLFNRKVQSMGTKTSGVWALTTTVTFS